MTDGNADKRIAELIYRSCFFLDELDIEGYMGLCAADFRYRITAYSPEILKEMVWQDISKTELKRHLDLIPKHVSDPSPLTRHPSVYLIEYDQDRNSARVLTGFEIFKTTIDSGMTNLYAVGKYHDVVSLEGKAPLLRQRDVKLATRQLGIGSQIPF